MGKDTCATPVLTVEEALSSGWAKESEMLRFSSDGEEVLNGPIKTIPAGRRHFTGAPSLGEHTDFILKRAGYTRAQVNLLRRDGAVA